MAPFSVQPPLEKVSVIDPAIVRFAFSVIGFSTERALPVAEMVAAALIVMGPVPNGPAVMTPPDETVSTPSVVVPAIKVVPPE